MLYWGLLLLENALRTDLTIAQEAKRLGVMICEIPLTRGLYRGESPRGTRAGADRHHQVGEKPCDECQHAQTEWNAERWRTKRPTRRVLEWCRAKQHRMTPENIAPLADGRRRCRACYRDFIRIYMRSSVFCDGCGRWLTPEAEEIHRSQPPGNPNAPMVCRNDSELMDVGLCRVKISNSKDIAEYWQVRPPKTHCKQGHPFNGDNLYVDPTTRQRCCKKCTNAASRRYRARKRANR